jgi:hypothetical protein
LEVGPLLVSCTVSLPWGCGFRIVFQRTGLGRRPVFRRRGSREAMRAGPYGRGRRVSRETVGPCQRALTGCQRLDGHCTVTPAASPCRRRMGKPLGAAIESSAPPTFHVKQGSGVIWRTARPALVAYLAAAMPGEALRAQAGRPALTGPLPLRSLCEAPVSRETCLVRFCGGLAPLEARLLGGRAWEAVSHQDARWHMRPAVSRETRTPTQTPGSGASTQAMLGVNWVSSPAFKRQPQLSAAQSLITLHRPATKIPLSNCQPMTAGAADLYGYAIRWRGPACPGSRPNFHRLLSRLSKSGRALVSGAPSLHHATHSPATRCRAAGASLHRCSGLRHPTALRQAKPRPPGSIDHANVAQERCAHGFT